MLAGAAVILVAVMALLLHALRVERSGRTVPVPMLLGGAGIVLPLLALAVLLVFALRTGERLLPHPGTGSPLVVEAHAHQWWWEFVYPDVGGAPLFTAGELHIPAGRPVDVRLVAHDVIHSFWVPRLGGKRDATPGHRTTIRLEASEPGTYRGQCAEFCGLQHTLMGFLVVAHEAEAFAERIGAMAARPAPDPAATGAAEFQAACGACHSADPRRRGDRAPNLAGLAGRQWLGGGAIVNDGPDAIAAWMATHPARKPGSREPDHSLLHADAAARIARLLQGLK